MAPHGFSGNGHGDFAEVNFAGRGGSRDIVATFDRVVVAVDDTRIFVEK